MESCKFFQQLVSAIDYLHKNGCAHRDVKPSNILVTSELDLKLIDFGLGNLYTEDEKLRTACGSPCYAAPEIIAGENYDPIPVDIWSSGITLFAMLCGYLPFDEESKSLLYKKILACDYSIPSHVSPEACDLVRRILVRDPNVRLNIDQIKEHPWFKKFKPCQVRTGFIAGKSEVPIDKKICKITAKRMKVPAKVISKMIKENEHNKYTTSKLERGELNEDKYSVDENDKISSSEEEITENYLEDEFFKPREDDKEIKRVKSQVKYRPKQKRGSSRKKSTNQRKSNKSKNGSSMSMDIKRPPVDRKKNREVSKENKSVKRTKSRKRSKKNSIVQEELPKISANINEIALEERPTSNTRSSNKSKNRPSNNYNFKDLFNSSRRKDPHDIKKKIFSKSNGNKKKKAASRDKGYLYNTNQSFKKGNSLRNWKRNLYITTDGKNEQNMTTSPPRYSKNNSKSSQVKESKNVNFLSKMLKKMLHRKKSPKVNFRKDYLGAPQTQHRTSQSYNTPTYSYFSNNGSSRRKSSKDKKNNQFFQNPNYSHSLNTQKVHRRNYSKQDFVTYIDSPLYLRQPKTTKAREYKIREMSHDNGSGTGYQRQNSKQKLSNRPKKKHEKMMEVYNSKKMNLRNVKLRKKIGALRSKKQ